MNILTESFPVDFIAKDDFNIKKTDCSGYKTWNKLIFLSNNVYISGCTICGENHETDSCSIFDNLQQVSRSL